MFCTQCGADNIPEAHFCHKCGNALSSTTTQTKGSVTSQSAEPAIGSPNSTNYVMAEKHKNKRPWWDNGAPWWDNVLGGIVVFVVIILFGIFYSRPDSGNGPTQDRSSAPVEEPKPRVIKFDRIFDTELSAGILTRDFTLTYAQSQDNDVDELTDVDLIVTLTSKESVKVQKKTATVSRWRKGQALTIEGFDSWSINLDDVGYEITGNAKSGDNIVKINQNGQFRREQ